MRLIDLDQTVFVPLVDESKGGVKYEMQMTIAEVFDKFFDGFQPETIDAIPVEWLEWRIMNAKYNGIKEAADAFEFVLKCWKEQEAR